MKPRKTVQMHEDSSPAIASTIEDQTVLQGADSFNQTSVSDTPIYLQGANSFNRPKVWTKTGKDNLVRHRSGQYYARVFGQGKEVWKSLKTSHFSVAQARLAEFLKDHRRRIGNGGGGNGSGISAKMTFGEAAEVHLRDLDNNVKIKPRTRAYYRERLRALEKSWPDLSRTEIRGITAGDCKAWAGRYGRVAAPTNFNNTVALLRHVFAVAVEAGVIYANPAAVLKRAALRGKEIALPSSDKFHAMVEEMRNGHGRFSRDCADFVEGLAYSGMRKGEANTLEWRDLDFTASEIAVRGDAVTGTKGGEGWRRVPMFKMLGLSLNDCDFSSLRTQVRRVYCRRSICAVTAYVKHKFYDDISRLKTIAAQTVCCGPQPSLDPALGSRCVVGELGGAGK